jgi:cell division protein FtsQ
MSTTDTLPAQSNLSGRLVGALRWIVALGVVAGSAATGVWLCRLEQTGLPVRVVEVEGAVQRLSAPILARTVTEHLHSGFLTQDLCTLRDAVQALPWVHTASLRRVWPDQIKLSVTEHRPIARWGDDGLVTAEGIVFRPDPDSIPTGLLRLDAEDAKAPLVAARFLEWRERLSGLGLKIAGLVLDARGAWTLRLGGGLRLELGTERVEERLGRFIRTYPQLAAAGQPELIDLRYANGLAVRWVEGRAPADLAVAQADPPEARAPEARPVRAKAASGGEGRNKSRNKG